MAGKPMEPLLHAQAHQPRGAPHGQQVSLLLTDLNSSAGFSEITACFPQSRSAPTEDGWQAGQISVASPGEPPQNETL